MKYIVVTLNEGRKTEKDVLLKECESQEEAEQCLSYFLNKEYNAYLADWKPEQKHEDYDFY